MLIDWYTADSCLRFVSDGMFDGGAGALVLCLSVGHCKFEASLSALTADRNSCISGHPLNRNYSGSKIVDLKATTKDDSAE